MYEAINFDGMKVFEETLPSSGWTVVSLLNQGYIYNQVRDVQRMVLLSCAMLGIVAVAMIAFVSRRMTRYVKISFPRCARWNQASFPLQWG